MLRGMGSERRVFSEQEVGEIVQRAAELQERSSERGYTPGVTREQLERVAHEVGVEPEFLERAIGERLAPPRQSGFLREEERVVRGELDPQNFDLVLSQVRARRSRRHPATQIGRTLQAQIWTGAGLANLEVTSRNERTRIRVKPFPVVEILGTLYPAFLATLLGGAGLAAAGDPIASALLAATAFTAGALGFRSWIRASNRRAARTAEKLEGVVASELERAALPATDQSPERHAQPVASPRLQRERE
jgi:hypothetical protein